MGAIAKIEASFVNIRTATLRFAGAGGKVVEVTAEQARAALSGSARNDPVAIAEALTALLQLAWDDAVLLSELPIDDPDRSVNPDLDHCFWKRSNGNLYRVSRTASLEIRWNGETFVPYNHEPRRSPDELGVS